MVFVARLFVTLFLFNFELVKSLQINSQINSQIYKFKTKINIKMYAPQEIIKEVAKKGIGSEWTYNDFIINIKNKNIEAATITDTNNLVAIDKHHGDIITPENLHLLKGLPQLTDNIVNKLIENNINFDIYNMPQGNFLTNIPFPIQFLFFYIVGGFILNFIAGRGISNNMMNNIGQFNKNSKILKSEDIDVRFDDVAGCEESKYELVEVVEFLKNPEKFEKSGAKIPSGILLEGPPGTGKTLLARAVAGEAGVSFISVSGSEFIEMFVGVGASRIRNLFKTANENTPCVIFIDEIDAIGRQRGTGFNSGNDEREQTLNQILTNMDGFDKKTGIIVLAATNRADILDSALTRPGRFDRKIIVPLPDIDGRKLIFKTHLRNKNYENLDLDQFSELTSGFSGADIANLVNEAAIISIRNNKTLIDNDSLYIAFEKVTIGLPKKNKNKNTEINELVSYHEAGHTIIAKLFNDLFTVRKVTINANNNGAGGYTLFTPKDEYSSYPTKKFLLAQLMVSLGGRAAEIILFKTKIKLQDNNYDETKLFEEIDNLQVTSGASNDLKQADNIARTYINLFGLNDTLVSTESNNNQPFLGRDLAMNSNKLSEFSKNKIDKEVANLLNFALKKTIDILMYNIDSLHLLSNKLSRVYSLDSDDLSFYNISYT